MSLTRRNLIILLIGTGILIFFAVLLFTRPALLTLFDYSQTGQIGDTIGGIASPIIGILGAMLVYLSFQEQIEANRIQREAFQTELRRNNATKDFQTLLDIFKQIKEDYSTLEYTSNSSVLKGKRALFAFKSDFQKDPKKLMRKAIYKDFTFLVEVTNLLIERCKSAELDEKDSSLLLKLIILFYNSKLETHVNALINTCESKNIGPNFSKKLQALKKNIHLIV